jgi:hypothetical protein
MDEQIFKTTIRNTRKTGVILWERTGQGMGFVAPGESVTLESWSSETPYSPYEEIIYKNDAIVELKENPLWPKPQGKWICTVINRDGREMERRIICGREMVLLRGIPIQVVTPCDDPWAVFSRMEIQEVRERGEHSQHSGYSTFSWRLKDVFTDRTESELEEIAAELEKLLDIEHVVV